jgi:hypothetical protein
VPADRARLWRDSQYRFFNSWPGRVDWQMRNVHRARYRKDASQ